jgi:type I restriction enzyme S subunit
MSVKLFQVFDTESRWLFEGEKRLDASFYAKDVIASKILIGKLEESEIAIETIDTMSKDIFHRSRFKRNYVGTGEGLPFLTPTDLLMFPLKPRKSVVNPPEGLQVSPRWILITCSGTIGRTIIANRFISSCILSHDVIRIIPKNGNLFGYLYAYLNTWMGQAILTKDRYGATVKHIEPHHVATIPIPRIPELEEGINQKILEAHRLREEAQELLLKAEEMLHSELGLPEIDVDDVEYLGGEKGRIVKSFEIKVSELNLRLDASYHIPLFHLAIQNLIEAKLGIIRKLGDVADSFVPPRFKRAYVRDPADGIPLLQGTHIPQIIPQDMKYIWNKMKNLNAYIVIKNWILVTCSGTIGRLSIVRDYWDEWAATNHLLRIIPNENEIHPGYLTAFLLSIYGQVQFQRLIYGGVVDEIGEAGELFNDILILKPKNKDIENKIGNFTFEAYDKKDKANQIEDEAIELLERRLKEIAE